MRYKDDLETELRKRAARRERKGKQKMRVSGRGILKIKDLIGKKQGN